MILQQALNEKVPKGISILQIQDNAIMLGSGEIFQGIQKQINDMIKKQTTNESTLLNHRKAIMVLQDDWKGWNEGQQSLEKSIELNNKTIQKLTTKQDLARNTKAMEETS